MIFYQLQYQELKLIVVSSQQMMAITTPVTSLSLSFTTPNKKSQVKQNILVTLMVMISSHIACQYDGHWCLGIVQ
jgi:hypothetical protein